MRASKHIVPVYAGGSRPSPLKLRAARVNASSPSSATLGFLTHVGYSQLAEDLWISGRQ